MADYIQLIAAALEKLATAVSKMEDARREAGVPVLRYRRFEIISGAMFWPAEGEAKRIGVRVGQRIHTYSLLGRSGRKMVAEGIVRACWYQPRLVLLALRRIQAATAWCLARAEGCRRAGEEIVRQQQEPKPPALTR